MDAAFLKGIRDEVRQRLREEGLATTFYKGVRYVIGRTGSSPRQDAFDRERGIYTNRGEPLWMMGVKGPSRSSARKYEAIEPAALKEMLGRLQSNWSGATFLDLGCGKGRALVVAAEAGFGQVVGVELSGKLAKLARRNLSKLGLVNAHVVHGDALEATFDVNDLVLYMYNPFGPAIMQRVAENIATARIPPKYIVYFNPFYPEPITGLARYELRVDDSKVKVWSRL